MSKHSLSGLRIIAIAGASVGLLVAVSGPVAASTTPTNDKSYSQNGSTAEVSFGGCTDNGDDTVTCTDGTISVFIGKMSDSSGVVHLNQVCAQLSSFTASAITGDQIGDPSFERGCRTGLPSAAIRIDSKLASATLAPTTLTFEQLVCDKEGCVAGTSREVTASGAWTQDGLLTTMKYRDSFNDGVCRWNEAFKGSGRNATFAGELAGTTIGPDSFPHMDTGKYTFRSRCSEG